MAFDWHEYLVLAEKFESTRKDEAALRCAVSRAYYAVFNQAEKFLRENGIGIKTLGIVTRLSGTHSKGIRTNPKFGRF